MSLALARGMFTTEPPGKQMMTHPLKDGRMRTGGPIIVCAVVLCPPFYGGKRKGGGKEGRREGWEEGGL